MVIVLKKSIENGPNTRHICHVLVKNSTTQVSCILCEYTTDLVMPYTITFILLLKEYIITVKISFFLFSKTT